jgi:hypothetical protein
MHALSIQKRSVNGRKRYAMNARYAMKIEKIPNHLHTYVHNHLKQRISRKFSWAQGRKISKYGPGHS